MQPKSKNQPQSQAQSRLAGREGFTQPDYHISGLAGALSMLFFIAAIAGSIIMDQNGIPDGTIFIFFIPMVLLSVYFLFALKVAKQWEKAVVLRLGRFRSLKGPGLFWVIPIIDTTPIWIDHREIGRAHV